MKLIGLHEQHKTSISFSDRRGENKLRIKPRAKSSRAWDMFAFSTQADLPCQGQAPTGKSWTLSVICMTSELENLESPYCPESFGNAEEASSFLLKSITLAFLEDVVPFRISLYNSFWPLNQKLELSSIMTWLEKCLSFLRKKEIISHWRCMAAWSSQKYTSDSQKSTSWTASWMCRMKKIGGLDIDLNEYIFQSTEFKTLERIVTKVLNYC